MSCRKTTTLTLLEEAGLGNTLTVTPANTPGLLYIKITQPESQCGVDEIPEKSVDICVSLGSARELAEYLLSDDVQVKHSSP